MQFRFIVDKCSEGDYVKDWLLIVRNVFSAGQDQVKHNLAIIGGGFDGDDIIFRDLFYPDIERIVKHFSGEEKGDMTRITL